MKPSEVLREARALLEPRGAWIQGRLRDGRRFCASGAVGAVEIECWAEPCIHHYLERVIKDQTIVAWNDAPSRRKGQVLAAFDRAIALAESEGQ